MRKEGGPHPRESAAAKRSADAADDTKLAASERRVVRLSWEGPRAARQRACPQEHAAKRTGWPRLARMPWRKTGTDRSARSRTYGHLRIQLQQPHCRAAAAHIIVLWSVRASARARPAAPARAA
eukprot:scaffold6600_cov125-Isochrysis_galbana.AAC.12